MSFNWNKYKGLNPAVRETLRQQEIRQRLDEKSQPNKSVQKVIYPKAIFMRLGHSSGNQYNGTDTIEIYKEFCNKRHCVWFSTNSLNRGMSKTKLKEFHEAINNGLCVEIYFAIGKTSGGNNDIQYMAEVIDIKSDPEGLNSPENELTPVEWQELNNKIWIKIQKIRHYFNQSVNDFVVVSSGNVLGQAIAKSQYQFGYIEKI